MSSHGRICERPGKACVPPHFLPVGYQENLSGHQVGAGVNPAQRDSCTNVVPKRQGSSSLLQVQVFRAV